MQPDLKTLLVPIIITEVETIEIVTGYLQVANGIITVPEVSWTTTLVTEQVGTEEVKIGTLFHTMDVTLVQDGFEVGSVYGGLSRN